MILRGHKSDCPFANLLALTVESTPKRLGLNLLYSPEMKSYVLLWNALIVPLAVVDRVGHQQVLIVANRECIFSKKKKKLPPGSFIRNGSAYPWRNSSAPSATNLRVVCSTRLKLPYLTAPHFLTLPIRRET